MRVSKSVWHIRAAQLIFILAISMILISPVYGENANTGPAIEGRLPHLAYNLSIIQPTLERAKVNLSGVDIYFRPAQQALTQVSLSEIPIELHRRASQLVEELRGSSMAPGWEKARLSDTVVPFYRPDMDGVAYLEFKVEPQGFIMLSATESDFPIPHWSSTSEPVSSRLKKDAQRSDKSVAKLFKLDSLSYVAEDASGEIAATFGDLPPKLSGMDSSWLDLGDIQLSEAIVPSLEAVNDERPMDAERRVEITGSQSSPMDIAAWESWSELKANYAESFRVLIEALRRDASQDWEIETLARKYGEGLLPGDTYKLPFLYPDAKYEINGEGKEYARFNLIEGRGLPSMLEITAISSPPSGSAEFEVLITYGERRKQETLKFNIIDPSKVTRAEEDDNAENLDVIEAGGLAKSELLRIQSSDWGPWNIFWAGSGADQRLYSQFTIGSCQSGCGATAWAMLFGWADHQAWVQNPYWKARWGIYRESGGYGADAEAPKYMDSGIKNIISEIRGYIGTWCIFGKAPTLPGNMQGAYKYLAGRTGTGMKTAWNPFGFGLGWIRERARDSIIDRKTPAVIGTGFLEHYPLAYGYAWRSRVVGWWIFSYTKYSRWFYVNQGWGGANNDWISADTWFAGEIYP